MEVAHAVLQSALDTDRLYKENMALQHGLERPKRIDLDAPNATAQQTAAPATSPVLSSTSKLAPYLISAALALGGGGIGSALTTWLTSRPEAAVSVPPPSSSPAAIGSDSLLSDLQERGFHLPPSQVSP